MADNSLDDLKVGKLSNIGEVVLGGTADINRVVITALANLNSPEVNEVLLAFKVRLKDRITGTTVFPRNGMVLPGGLTHTEE